MSDKVTEGGGPGALGPGSGGLAAPPTGWLSRAAEPRVVWAALVGVTPAATVAAALALWPLWLSDRALALSVTVLFAGLFAMGVALLGEPGQRAPGCALIGSSLLLVVNWAEEWGLGPLPFLSTVLGNQWLLLGAWALYRYPDQRLGRRDRWFFVVMCVWFSLPPLAVAVVSRPQWHSFPTDAWWPALFPDQGIERVEDLVNSVGLVLIAVTYIGLWVARVRTSRPVQRRLITPPGVAAIVATAAAALVPIGEVTGTPDEVMDRIYLVEAAAIVVVPVAFLVAIIRRQLSRTRVTELILGIKGPPSTRAIVAALRTALEDPRLDLAYWSPDAAAYILPDGGPLREPQREGRVTATVDTTSGEPLALVLADPALIRDPDLLTAAGTVAGFSLEIARLLETVHQQLHAVQAAGARAVQAADAERRRLEQDLHDGAQQHLLALGPLIGAAEASTADPATAAQLAEIRDLLTRALRELREFAHGVHPTALAHGLPIAVTAVTRALPLTAVVDLPQDELPKESTHAAYLVISEALANAAKHARATTVSVTGHLTDGVLAVQVTDDGIGGAHANGGRGIPNMTDRVAALGGYFSLESPPGAGTTLRMTLPCG